MAPGEPSGAVSRSPVRIGRISGFHGVHGWVKVYSDTRPPENIFSYDPWLIDTGEGWRELKVAKHRRQGRLLLARFEGLEDRDAVTPLLNCEIAIDPAQLPPPGRDEYYWETLIGLEVVNRDGQSLGRVQGIIETGGHDVLVVAGEKERLIPFVGDVYIDAVEPEADRIRVDWDAERW
ncbi:MAG: ribosome maturation factor RimM [Gammaproteobacteria bacterium]|nr:MAG: ribosome maturation factor RimM [Gammaproteobacteria bacterium]